VDEEPIKCVASALTKLEIATWHKQAYGAIRYSFPPNPATISNSQYFTLYTNSQFNVYLELNGNSANEWKIYSVLVEEKSVAKHRTLFYLNSLDDKLNRAYDGILKDSSGCMTLGNGVYLTVEVETTNPRNFQKQSLNVEIVSEKKSERGGLCNIYESDGQLHGPSGIVANGEAMFNSWKLNPQLEPENLVTSTPLLDRGNIYSTLVYYNTAAIWQLAYLSSIEKENFADPNVHG
jgi:hypothetical protein